MLQTPIQADRILTSLTDIKSDFALLEDWEDRYRYVIELGRALPAFPEDMKTEAHKVRGCASQVWLVTGRVAAAGGGDDRMRLQGTSDAMIVQGLIAVLFSIYDGKTLNEILATDAQAVFAELGLKEHLTPQRSNGLAAMVQRIRADAEAMLAAQA